MDPGQDAGSSNDVIVMLHNITISDLFLYFEYSQIKVISLNCIAHPYCI